MFSFLRRTPTSKNKLVVVAITAKTCGACFGFKAHRLGPLKDLCESKKIEFEHFDFNNFRFDMNDEERKKLFHPGVKNQIGHFPIVFLFVKDTWDNHAMTLVGENIDDIQRDKNILDDMIRKYGNRKIYVPVPFVMKHKECLEEKASVQSETKIIIKHKEKDVREY